MTLNNRFFGEKGYSELTLAAGCIPKVLALSIYRKKGKTVHRGAAATFILGPGHESGL